jgi:2-phosphosulfolactate phosphatase
LKVHVATAVSTGRTFKNSVIVDTFRSSSTIIAALGNGVKAVIPYSTVGDALRARNATRNRSGVILVGERNGIMPKGFDCNISPLDMTRERIGGKTILYSSSNLTRILGKLKARTRILVGGINNAKAVGEYLKLHCDEAMIVACGTVQGPTIEDLAGAGAIVDCLATEELTDDALVALGLYRSPYWRHLIGRGRIAERLCSLGYQRDIEFCLSPNISSVVPGLVNNRIIDLNART